MKKNAFVFALMLAILLAAGAVPSSAKEPMTISGVWLIEEEVELGVAKLYWYFSPGDADGTAVCVFLQPDILGGQQVLLFTGTWDFEEKDGVQLFCVYRVRMYVSGSFIATGDPLPGQGIYRFYTEGGKQKFEHTVRRSSDGTLGTKTIYTKIGTKLSDLPELGILAQESNKGGAFWRKAGINVR